MVRYGCHDYKAGEGQKHVCRSWKAGKLCRVVVCCRGAGPGRLNTGRHDILADAHWKLTCDTRSS